MLLVTWIVISGSGCVGDRQVCLASMEMGTTRVICSTIGFRGLGTKDMMEDQK